MKSKMLSSVPHSSSLGHSSDQIAVVLTIRGQAWITGFAQLVVDVVDPFHSEFTVGDIWVSSIDLSHTDRSLFDFAQGPIMRTFAI